MKRLIGGWVLVALLGSMFTACEPTEDDDAAALGLLLLLFIAGSTHDSMMAEDACPVAGESWCEGDQVMACETVQAEGDARPRPAIRARDLCGQGACLEEERDGVLEARCGASLP